MLSETDPDTEEGELVARDCGAEDTGSSTITSMSLLLSSASASGGNEPGWSSLLREIWPRTGAHTDIHTVWGSAPRGTREPGRYSKGETIKGATQGTKRRKKGAKTDRRHREKKKDGIDRIEIIRNKESKEGNRELREESRSDRTI